MGSVKKGWIVGLFLLGLFSSLILIVESELNVSQVISDIITHDKQFSSCKATADGKQFCDGQVFECDSISDKAGGKECKNATSLGNLNEFNIFGELKSVNPSLTYGEAVFSFRNVFDFDIPMSKLSADFVNINSNNHIERFEYFTRSGNDWIVSDFIPSFYDDDIKVVLYYSNPSFGENKIKVDWKPKLEIGTDTFIRHDWAWFNTDWDYRKNVTISPDSGLQDNRTITIDRNQFAGNNNDWNGIVATDVSDVQIDIDCHDFGDECKFLTGSNDLNSSTDFWVYYDNNTAVAVEDDWRDIFFCAEDFEDLTLGSRTDFGGCFGLSKYVTLADSGFYVCDSSYGVTIVNGSKAVCFNSGGNNQSSLRFNISSDFDVRGSNFSSLLFDGGGGISRRWSDLSGTGQRTSIGSNSQCGVANSNICSYDGSTYRLVENMDSLGWYQIKTGWSLDDSNTHWYNISNQDTIQAGSRWTTSLTFSVDDIDTTGGVAMDSFFIEAYIEHYSVSYSSEETSIVPNLEFLSNFSNCLQLSGFQSGNVDEPVYADLGGVEYDDEKMKYLVLTKNSGCSFNSSVDHERYDSLENNASWISFIYDGVSDYYVYYNNESGAILNSSFDEDLFLLAEPFEQYDTGVSLLSNDSGSFWTNGGLYGVYSSGNSKVGDNSVHIESLGTNFFELFLNFSGGTGVVSEGNVSFVFWDNNTWATDFFEHSIVSWNTRTDAQDYLQGIAYLDQLYALGDPMTGYDSTTARTIGNHDFGEFDNFKIIVDTDNDVHFGYQDNWQPQYSGIMAKKGTFDTADQLAFTQGAAGSQKNLPIYLDELFASQNDLFLYNISSSPLIVGEEQGGNTAPSFEPIADIEKDEDFSQFTIDLSDNISDAEDSDADLQVSYELNETDIITINSLDNSTNIMTISSQANISGVVNISLTLVDTGGLTAFESFDLVVNQVNDYPWWDETGNATATNIDEDSGEPLDVNASQYWWDVEDGQAVNNITISTNESDVDCYMNTDNNFSIFCNPTSNFTGDFIMTLNGTDLGSLSAIESFEGFVTNINDAPWGNIFGNVTADEDFTVFDAILKTDLDLNFSDVEDNNVPTTYEFIESTNSSTSCYFDASNNFKCASLSNDSGTDYYKFSLNDSGGLGVVFDWQIIINAVNDVPSVPYLDSPVNESNVTSLLFMWSNSTDVEGDSISYIFEVLNLSFSTIYYNESIVEIGSPTQEENISSVGLAEGDYYWRVLANDSDNSSWSEMWYFSYDATEPLILLESPANETTQGGYSNGVMFSYNVSDINYIDNCSLIIDGQTNVTNTGISKDISQNFSISLENDKYEWGVNCTDNFNNQNSSEIRIFTMNWAPKLFGGGGVGGSVTCSMTGSKCNNLTNCCSGNSCYTGICTLSELIPEEEIISGLEEEEEFVKELSFISTVWNKIVGFFSFESSEPLSIIKGEDVIVSEEFDYKTWLGIIVVSLLVLAFLYVYGSVLFGWLVGFFYLLMGFGVIGWLIMVILLILALMWYYGGGS